MNRDEAFSFLKQHMDLVESSGYEALAKRVGENKAFEIKAPSGKSYQIEITIVWDHKQFGAIRILESIDDGGWRAFVPLTNSRLLYPPSIP